jgi:hypothetical protein
MVVVLFSCVATTTLAQAAKPPDSSAPTKFPFDSFPSFSAVMIGSRAEPGKGISQGHIYRSGKLLRMDEPGGSAYFVTDLNSGETYGILETGCMRDNHPYIRAIPFYMPDMADATVTRASAGKETVDGQSCQVEEVTVSSPMLANPLKMRLWEADDLQGFPIKVEFVLPGGHGPIIRYENVVLGAQDAALFIHPKSCQPIPQKPTAPPTH